MGMFSHWTLSPLHKTQVVFENVLAFDYDKISRVILQMFYSRFEMSYFFKKSQFLLVENAILEGNVI